MESDVKELIVKEKIREVLVEGKKLPVINRKREMESGHEEASVKKKRKHFKSGNEESPAKKRKRKPESGNEETPVKKRKRKSESGNEESPVTYRERKSESENEETLMKKERKSESGKEDTPVKRERKSNSGKEETPIINRVRKTESVNEETSVKKREQKTELGNETTPIERREKRKKSDNEELISISEKNTKQAITESPGNNSEKEVEREINIELENEASFKTEDGDSEAEDEQLVSRVERKTELGDILKDINDLNEPSCIDKILMYLEEIKDEDYMFMELLVDRLHGETITWEQPWYQQSNSLSRPLKDANNENDPKPYRTDTICKAECVKIQENWNEFRKLYEIPDKLICLARWKNKDKSRLPNTPEEQARRYVVAYLARGLQRTIYQVFRHIMTYFGGTVKGAYSSDEEKIMKVCFMHHPNHSVTLLSMVLSREPRGIYKRLQQMFNGKPEKKKLKWTLPLATRLLVLLLKYTNLPLEELKYRKIDKAVWLKLEKKFNHHYIYLQNFWYDTLHTQVFVKESYKVNKLRKAVFKKLKTSSYQVWTDIRWKDLVKQFPDGLTHRFLYKISRGVVYKIPDYLKKPLSEIADNALDKLSTHQFRKRRLKTLQFNESGDLEVVKRSSSKLYETYE